MSNVFISSTYEDLKEYRQAAIEVCRRLGLEPIAMEEFEASGQPTTENSIDRLNSAHVYVGIFAHRYGRTDDRYGGRSVTEIEFDHAGKCQLERLCFLVKPEHPWNPTLMEQEHGSRDKLQDFKRKISEEVSWQSFTTLEDFESKLEDALRKWQKQNSPPDKVTPNDVLECFPQIPELASQVEDIRNQLLDLHYWLRKRGVMTRPQLEAFVVNDRVLDALRNLYSDPELLGRTKRILDPMGVANWGRGCLQMV